MGGRLPVIHQGQDLDEAQILSSLAARMGLSPLYSADLPELTLSERAILDAIRKHPNILRTDIPDRLALSQQSTHRIVARLDDLGLIVATTTPTGRQGKPSLRLSLNGKAAYSFGISINSDTLIVVLLDLAGELVEERRWRTAPLSRDHSLAILRAELPTMLRQKGIAPGRVIGAGVAIAGFFYGDNGRVFSIEPLQDWSCFALHPFLEEQLDMPVLLANSARTSAVGESLRGIGQLYRTFAYLHFDYGFGAGVVIDGNPYFGPRGNAGEMAVVYSDSELDDRPRLLTLVEALRRRDVGIKTLDDLAGHFDPTWPEVASWLDRVTPGLNRVVHALAGSLDPQAIIFGGQAPVVLAHMLIGRVQFRGANPQGIMTPRPALVVSESIGDAAACGAAMILLKDRFFT